MSDIIEISHKISEKNKIGILHIDLVDGLTNREIVLEYLKEKTKFDGIISTKAQTVKSAKKLGLVAIQRVFILDSLSFQSTKNHLVDECDAVEMLPGLLFKVIKELSKDHTVIIVAHRLSTIVDADNIFVVDKHKICASGTHIELMNNCEEYKNLYEIEE